MTDFSQQRLNMVEGQLRPSRVVDPRVLEAVAAVPRERFVPERLRHVAYADEDLPLGGGRFLTEPLVLARLIQAASIAGTDTVLVVGCASGYGAAIIARLAHQVVALECDVNLAAAAQASLMAVGAVNVEVVTGPLAAGWPRGAPYQAIVIEGAVAAVPPALLDQIAEGGRLAAVVRPNRSGKATLYRRIAGTIASVEQFDAACPPLPGFAAKPAFVF